MVAATTGATAAPFDEVGANEDKGRGGLAPPPPTLSALTAAPALLLLSRDLRGVARPILVVHNVENLGVKMSDRLN